MKKINFLLTVLLAFTTTLSGQWRYLPGPEGGEASAFDINGDTIYVLTDGGVFQSLDKGLHWDLIKGSKYAPRRRSTFQVENGVFYANSLYYPPTISTDGGKSWNSVLVEPLLPYPGENLRFVFAKADTVLMLSTHTIYRSINGGQDWEVTSDLFGTELKEIFELNGEYYAWGGRYVYRSSDGARNWERVLSVAGSFVKVSPVGSDIFAIYNTGEILLKSGDGFRTWNTIYTDSIRCVYGSHPLVNVKLAGGGQRLYCFYSVDLDLFDCKVFMSYSDDGGLNWYRNNGGKLFGLNVNSVQQIDDHILLAHENGLNLSKDSLKTHQPIRVGIYTRSIFSFAAQEGKIYANSWLAANVSADEGQSWTEINQGQNSYCRQLLTVSGTKKRLVLADINENDYKLSDDEGLTWRKAYIDLYQEVACSENTVWWLENSDLTFLRDQDATSTTINLWARFQFAGGSITAFADGVIVKSYDGDYWVLNEDGELQDQFPAPPCDAATQPGFFMDQTIYNGANCYYFCGQNAYVLKEGASSWETIYPQDWESGVPLYHDLIWFIVEHKGVLWVGLFGKGLFYSTDNGQRFFQLKPQLPFPFPGAIQFRNNEIWVAILGGGIYVTGLTKSPSETDVQSLIQFSPNPSNGELHLELDVFFTEPLRVSIRDASGREVGNTVLTPGYIWDISFPNLPRGLYFFSLTTPFGVIGKKWVIDR